MYLLFHNIMHIVFPKSAYFAATESLELMYNERRVGLCSNHGLGLVADVSRQTGHHLSLNVIKRFLQASNAVSQVILTPVRNARLRYFLHTIRWKQVIVEHALHYRTMLHRA